jgi:hypothetical protein
VNTVARELRKCKLHIIGAQKVRWVKGSTERAEEYTFSYGEENEVHQLGTGFLNIKRIISAVRTVEFVSDRLSI